MLDYRHFYASLNLENTDLDRRQLLGLDPKRVYRLPPARRGQRSCGRR